MSTSVIEQNRLEILPSQKWGRFWGRNPQKRGRFWGKMGLLLGQNGVGFGAKQFYNTLISNCLRHHFSLIIILIKVLNNFNYIETATQNFEILGSVSCCPAVPYIWDVVSVCRVLIPDKVFLK